MIEEYEVVILGTGEIGKPLYELLKGVYKSLPVDPIHHKNNVGLKVNCEYLHVCIPGNISNFENIVIDYINFYNPKAVIIHSTVIPGTTKRINTRVSNRCVFSPVNGKHTGNNMKKDLLRCTKIVGTDEESIGLLVYNHLYNLGITKIYILDSTLAAEWGKVLITTHFGYMIAWAQEVERIADECCLKYDDLIACISERDDIVPPHYPGIIGGHCVMPNIELIEKIRPSKVLDWIKWSNDAKKEREK